MGLVETRLQNEPEIASADVTTSGGVILLSVDTTGAQSFTLVNRGSISVYINGSFAAGLFVGSVALTNPADKGSANVAISSATGQFDGAYQVIRVIANSGSGVYRPTLIYR